MTQEQLATKALKYKKKISNAFMLVDGAKLIEKITGEDFCVTKKLDGVMQIVFVEDGNAIGSSKSGKMLEGAACLEELASLCGKAGIKSAVIAAELYVRHDDGKRERVGEVSTALASDPKQLCLAPFDILEIEGEPFETPHYRDTLAKLNNICSGGSLVKPVESKTAGAKGEVAQIYKEWVEDGGAEGIVVHSELPIIYKVKPKHTLDAAVVGYTVRDEDPNQIRDLAFGLQREDGLWQLLCTTSNGIAEQQRTDICSALLTDGANSDYILTDSRGVAYKMVRPRIVAELSAIDFVTENATGEAKMNPLLAFTMEEGWQSKGNTAGVSVLHSVIERIREDKTPADAVCSEADVRLSQLTDLVAFAECKEQSLQDLPKSEMLVRRVYTKGADAKLMVQKFIVYKTNKEDSGRFPAYVLHHTDYSCGRKEALKRDIRVSSSKEQIMQLLDLFIADNIKKGWEEMT